MPEQAPTLADILATPDFFPMKIDRARDELFFIRMSRESFRQSAFLDRRAVRATPDVVSVSLAELRAASPQLRPECPLHVILHTAFCGSTLLARYLEQLPHCLVLKEPALLGRIQGLKNGEVLEPDTGKEWYGISLALLGRSYAEDSAVIVKATDASNWMGSLLLEHNKRLKLVFMFSPLEIFLLSALKQTHRRGWLAQRIAESQTYLAGVPFLSKFAGRKLSDAQNAVMLWLLNAYLCRSLMSRADGHRVLILNGEELIARPQERLTAVANFLDLTQEDANRAALSQFQPLSQHAKDLQTPYDADARKTELSDLRTQLGAEVDAAIAWARKVGGDWLAQSPFPVNASK